LIPETYDCLFDCPIILLFSIAIFQSLIHELKMPHSKHSVPTARNLSFRTATNSSTARNDRLPTAPKPAYQAAGKRRKANSAPPVLVNGRIYPRYSSEDAGRTNEFCSSYSRNAVNNPIFTSRPTSPSSSYSATDTLAHFSDSSSVTATEAASPTSSPKLTKASVASRRYKFKEEFGTENEVGASANVYAKHADHQAAYANQHIKHADPFYEHQSIVPPHAHERTTIRADKQVEHDDHLDSTYDLHSTAPPHTHKRTTVRAVKPKKTKTRSKKTTRSCAPNLDFAYRNVYTAATGIGDVNVASPASGMGKGRDGFEGPNVATAHVGCVVM